MAGAATTPPSDFSLVITEYESAAYVAGDFRWITDADLRAETVNYYDRAYAWYALGHSGRGDHDQQRYMDEYAAPNGGGIPAHYWFPDGLIENYLRNGGTELLVTLEGMAHWAYNHLIGGWVDCYESDPDWCRWEGRIQERVLLTAMAADAMNVPNPRHDYREVARRTKDAILSTQSPDGSWLSPMEQYTDPATGEQVSSNFMSAAAMSALTRYAEYYNEDVAAIEAAVAAGAEWLWTTQWRVDGSFNYWSGAGKDVATPDLNMIFVDVFGWLYKQTRDPKWAQRGDAIFTAGVVNRVNIDREVALHKQYSVYTRNAWRYLYYRTGYDISHLRNPTEVHN